VGRGKTKCFSGEPRMTDLQASNYRTAASIWQLFITPDENWANCTKPNARSKLTMCEWLDKAIEDRLLPRLSPSSQQIIGMETF